MGSHLYNCQSYDRRLIGLDHCANRHCPTCGYERREEWRESMIDWTLDCENFHIVFTLPHTLWPVDLCQQQADVPDPLPHCDSVFEQHFQEGVRLRTWHGFDLAYLGTEDESSYPCAHHHDRWWSIERQEEVDQYRSIASSHAERCIGRSVPH